MQLLPHRECWGVYQTASFQEQKGESGEISLADDENESKDGGVQVQTWGFRKQLEGGESFCFFRPQDQSLSQFGEEVEAEASHLQSWEGVQFHGCVCEAHPC